MPDWTVGRKEEMKRCVHELVFSKLEVLDIFGRYVYEFSGFPRQFYVEESYRVVKQSLEYVLSKIY